MGRVSSSLIFFTKTKSNKFRFYEITAEIAQLVEHNLAKVGVASSSLVFRSKLKTAFSCLFLFADFSSEINVEDTIIKKEYRWIYPSIFLFLLLDACYICLLFLLGFGKCFSFFQHFYCFLDCRVFEVDVFYVFKHSLYLVYDI